MKWSLPLVAILFLSAPVPVEASSPSASSLFASGSSPSTVSASLAKAVSEDPTLSPDLVVEVVDAFARSLSGEDLGNAVEEIFRALAEIAPESLVSALAAVCSKYPQMAIPAARGAVQGAPNMARFIAETVYASTPTVDIELLSSTIATTAAVDQSLVVGWLDNPLGWSSLPAAAFPGGGGSTRPEPYSN